MLENHLSFKHLVKVVVAGVLAIFTEQGANYILPALNAVPQTAEVIAITGVYYAIYNYATHNKIL